MESRNKKLPNYDCNLGVSVFLNHFKITFLVILLKLSFEIFIK